MTRQRSARDEPRRGESDPISFPDAYRAASLSPEAARALCRRLRIDLFKQPAYTRRWFMTPADAERLRVAAATPRPLPDGLTGAEAAKALGISRQRVHVLLTKGLLQRAASGLVDKESVARRLKSAKAHPVIARG